MLNVQPVPAANRSIEISSPRLHYGRAAVYGSTIMPLRIVALHRSHPCISARVLIGGQTDSRSSTKGCTELDTMRFSRYRGHMYPLHFLRRHGKLLKISISEKICLFPAFCEKCPQQSTAGTRFTRGICEYLTQCEREAAGEDPHCTRLLYMNI